MKFILSAAVLVSMPTLSGCGKPPPRVFHLNQARNAVGVTRNFRDESATYVEVLREDQAALAELNTKLRTAAFAAEAQTEHCRAAALKAGAKLETPPTKK